MINEQTNIFKDYVYEKNSGGIEEYRFNSYTRNGECGNCNLQINFNTFKKMSFLHELW